MNNKFFKVYTRIRSLREDHDLTQKKIASILNMSQTGYSKYETGENDIPTRILINLSLYYDTSIDYLLGITDEQKPYTRSKTLEDTDIPKTSKNLDYSDIIKSNARSKTLGNINSTTHTKSSNNSMM